MYFLFVSPWLKCFLFIFSAKVLHLKFAMYSICLTSHLEFENWKHILSFVTSLTSTPRTLGEGELGRLVPEALGRGHLKVFLSLNHASTITNIKIAEGLS